MYRRGGTYPNGVGSLTAHTAQSKKLCTLEQSVMVAQGEAALGTWVACPVIRMAQWWHAFFCVSRGIVSDWFKT